MTVLCLVSALSLSARAQQTDGVVNRDQDDWKFDRIVLSTGRTIEGLILAGDDEADVEFVEVRRHSGKPMNLVIRPIERRTIGSISALDDADRTRLRARLDKFIHRATIEARRMEDIKLSLDLRDDVKYWQYHGNWFWLESTADEETTRRAAVRIEQIFTAYRQILPPRRSSQRRLKIMLFGAESQYAAFLGGLGLEIANPAFFAADFNVVAAGSNINHFTEQLAATGAQHKHAREQFDAEVARLPARLAALADQLRKNGVPESDRKAVIASEQRTWQERRQKLVEDIAHADRRNASKFEQVTGEMFARLYHEAFHAYLDNYVYPHHEFNVPRWLNEGLALTFEGGLLEGDTLRIDAPNRRVLRVLQDDLRGPNPMSLAELLSADADAFLPAHKDGEGSAARLYAYSWGLAYYLTFDQSLLDSPTFAEFVAPTSSNYPAISRFEKLVGESLDKFEQSWRAAMLKMR
jgi:hypothetical protein